MDGYGKLRRCTEQNVKIVNFYLYLATALVTIRQLIQRARNRYRWDTRPTTQGSGIHRVMSVSVMAS